MKFITHPQHTRHLGAPVGWNHSEVHCGSLSIHDTTTGNYPAMESAWKPEGFEGARLALGEATLRLTVIGQNHPPVSLHIDSPEPDRATKRANLTKLLAELIEYARKENFWVEVSTKAHSVTVGG